MKFAHCDLIFCELDCGQPVEEDGMACETCCIEVMGDDYDFDLYELQAIEDQLHPRAIPVCPC